MTLSDAIDGPAGAGKSTVALRVASALGLPLVDTGAIYRSLALLAKRKKIGTDDAAGLTDLARSLNVRFVLDGEVNRIHLHDEDVTDSIRKPDISMDASSVSRHPAVRSALLSLQRAFVESQGAVLEGRDIGTEVLPHASLKFFLDAKPEERARRRYEEMEALGLDCEYRQVLAEVIARDDQDRSRSTAPLKPADDAVVLDSTEMSIDEVVGTIVDAARRLT